MQMVMVKYDEFIQVLLDPLGAGREVYNSGFWTCLGCDILYTVVATTVDGDTSTMDDCIN